jgi:hypothetical protein
MRASLNRLGGTGGKAIAQGLQGQNLRHPCQQDPQGDDVSCDIVKTWSEADIAKMLGGKIDWPWSKAVCRSKLEVKRESLVKAMTQASYEVVMPEQKVRCTLCAKEGRRSLRGRGLDRAQGCLQGWQGGQCASQLGRGDRAHARLCLDLCRDWTRQFGQRWCT